MKANQTGLRDARRPRRGLGMTWGPRRGLGMTWRPRRGLGTTWGLALGALLLVTSFARAQDQAPAYGDSLKKAYPSEGPLGEEFRDVAYELRCPTCTGLSVLESDAKFSVQIKDIVQEQVEAGKSKAEILQFFTERYGPWILRSPPAKGFNLLAWLLPIGALLLGPPAVWFFVWRKRRVVSRQGVRSTDDIITEMHARLDQLRVKA